MAEYGISKTTKKFAAINQLMIMVERKMPVKDLARINPIIILNNSVKIAQMNKMPTKPVR